MDATGARDVRGGELHETLGRSAEPQSPPQINVSPGAARALAEALEEATSQEPGSSHHIRVEIDPDFQHALSVTAKQARDVEVPLGSFSLVLDRASARRAEGLNIDYVDGPEGAAFKLENPNEPPRVKSIDVKGLAAKMAEDKARLFDVRSQDSAIAPIAKR